MICYGCGGVVGRDCFNPQECEEITRDQEMRYQQDQERDREAAYRRTAAGQVSELREAWGDVVRAFKQALREALRLR